MSKTANIVLKDSPAEPLLPQKLFTEPDLVRVHCSMMMMMMCYKLHSVSVRIKFDVPELLQFILNLDTVLYRRIEQFVLLPCEK